MVSAAAPCASPKAMSAAAAARQPIDETGFMCVPPARQPTSAGLVLRASLPCSRPAKRQAGRENPPRPIAFAGAKTNAASGSPRWRRCFEPGIGQIQAEDERDPGIKVEQLLEMKEIDQAGDRLRG